MINKLSSSKATGPGAISVKTTEHAFSGLLSSSYQAFQPVDSKGDLSQLMKSGKNNNSLQGWRARQP